MGTFWVVSRWRLEVELACADRAADLAGELALAVELEVPEESESACLFLESRLLVPGSEQGPDLDQLSELKRSFCRELSQLLESFVLSEPVPVGEDVFDNQASAASGGSSEALAWVRGQGDKLGLGVDREVEAPVAAMRVLGLRTVQSCGGHFDHGLPYPWIDVDKRDWGRLREVLSDRPLPGFGLWEGGSFVRLMPEQALSLGAFEVLARVPDGVEAEPDLEARASLLACLPERQRSLQLWACRVLSSVA